MRTDPPLTPADAAAMVSHNLGCPPNGYLGQDYGVDLKSKLQKPMQAGVWDDLVEKIRVDVPLAGRLGAGGLNVYAYDLDIDKKAVVVEVGGVLVPTPGESL